MREERPGVEPVWDQNQPAWDETRARWDERFVWRDSRRRLAVYGAVAAVALAIGIVNALSKAQDVAWRGGVYDVRTPLFWEMTSIAVIILLAPALFVAVRRIRHASGWPLRIATGGGGDHHFFRPAHRRHGRPPQTRYVAGRRLVRFPLFARDA